MRHGNDTQNVADFAAIRVQNGGLPEGDTSFMILPDFEDNPGQPMGVQNGLILLANRGWGLLDLG